MTKTAARTHAVGLTEASKIVGVSKTTLIEAINGDGSKWPMLPAKRVGRNYSITVDDVVAWHDSLPTA